CCADLCKIPGSAIPVSDVIVKVATRDGNGRQIAATMTSTDGRFTFEHLAPDTYVVSAEHYSRSNQRFYQQDLTATTTVDGEG
ncbi:MAG: carboxypeptidase-like regulatory domain-containing protein, partial [Planctomycetales bacterium]